MKRALHTFSGYGVLWIVMICMWGVAVVAEEAKPKTDPKKKPDTKAEPKPKTDPKAEPKTEPKVEAKNDPKPKTDPKAKVDPKATAQTDPKAEPKAEPKPDGSDSEDDAHALLAKRDREKGAQRFGKDPSFLVFPRPLERSEAEKELMTPQIKAMIEKGLAYLARCQDADGGWSDKQYPANAGVTAMACMAFMAEGSQPRVGRFGKNIDRGMEYLLKNVQSSGAIVGKNNFTANSLYGPMYGAMSEHTFACLALLLANGDMPWRPEVRDVVAKAVQAIGRSQHLDGGWRFALTKEGSSDMPITSDVLWVLRTAKKSGFSVSADSIARGLKYVESCARPDGTFRYRQFGLHAEASLGGIGVVALSSNGNIDNDLIPAARDRIEYDYRRYTIEDLRQRQYFTYQCFFASLAMYSVGDKYWLPFYKKAVQVLAAIQKPDGEFPDEFGNQVYSTAFALLILQAPQGYMPLYER